MKKTFLFRLFVFAFFCIASLSIKSETGACKVQCKYAVQNATIVKSLITSDVHESPSPLNHDDGFFIRI